MHLSPRETKLIERLRRQDDRWPRDRWILLFGGIFIFACYGCVVAQLMAALQSDDFAQMPVAMTLLFAVFWPKCLFGFFVGACLIGLAIRDWHGDVHRILLLKLLDEQRKTEV